MPKTIKTCPSGEGYTEGAAISDSSTCNACIGAKFSNAIDAKDCQNHSTRNCPAGQGIEVGTATADAFCKTLAATFSDELDANNVTAALDTLDAMLISATAANTTAATEDIQLTVVSNLEKVAALPNSTAARRRQVATILSESVFDFADSDGKDGGSGNAGASATTRSDVSNSILAKTSQVVASLVAGAINSNTRLATVTSQALIESTSSVLRTTAGNDDAAANSGRPGSENLRSSRLAIVAAVEAVASATNRSAPVTSIVARSISFTRTSIVPPGGQDAANEGLPGSSIEINAYDPATKQVGQEANENDPRGLARPSAVSISSSLVQGGYSEDGGGGGSVDAFVFQYSQSTNPFSSQVASDVVVVRIDDGFVVNKSAGEPAGALPLSPVGNVSINFNPRSSNNSQDDECKVVFNVEANGNAGLESALTNVCATWNGSSFAPTKGCRLSQAEMNSTAGTWSLICQCAVDKSEIENSVTASLIDYTFDRFGRVFSPGRIIKPSVAPLVITILPTLVALVALVAITLSRSRKTRVRKRPLPPELDNAVVNPLHTASMTNIKERQQRCEEWRRRASVTRAPSGDNATSSAEGGTIRIIRGIFGVQTNHEEDDQEEDRTKAASMIFGMCLRYSWQRRWWLSMQDSHELLAIFKGPERRGMGLNERLVIFLGCFYSNMLGATLMYYQYSCYELKSIFAEDAMDLGVIVEARVSMMVLASLFTIPVNAVVSITFMIQETHLNFISREGKANRNGHKAGSCRCWGEKSKRAWFFFVSILGWAVAVAQIVICGVAVVIMTATKTSDGANSAKVPCRCRISHNEQQSGRWLLMIGFSTWFWLLFSRPGSIGIVLFLTQCKQRANKEWIRRRSSISSMSSMKPGIEMVVASLKLGDTDAGKTSGDTVVRITRRGSTDIDHSEDGALTDVSDYSAAGSQTDTKEQKVHGGLVDLTDGRFRARLVRFYTKYDAGKLRGVDAKMEQYKDGKEVQLFKALVKKFGPEPLEDDGGGGGSGELSNAETNGDDSLRDIEVRRIMSIGRRGMKPKLERRSKRFGGSSSKDDKNKMFEPSSTGKNQALAATPSRADKKRRGKKKTFAVESTEVRSHPRQVAQDSKGLAVGTDEMEGAVSSSVSRSQSIAL
jgi:hypothetical protein